MQTKFHFAALIGVDYELDIFDHWANYYLDMRFDTYTIFLHREKGSIPNCLVKHVKDKGFMVECFDGSHADGRLRGEVCRYHASKLPDNDFLITADGDEYQSCPGFPGAVKEIPPNYRLLEKHFDLITGFMSDRWGDSLEESEGDPFIQYPYEETFTGDIQKNVVPHFLNPDLWRQTRRTKILAARAGYKTGFEGSHLMSETPSNARIAEGFRVVHFAWRESARRKVAVKSYFTLENLDEVYGGRAPDELRNDLLRRQPDTLMKVA